MFDQKFRLSTNKTQIMGKLQLSIRSPSGDKFDVECEEDITVLEFKELIASKANIPAAQQRLIYRGRVLKDPKTLKESGSFHSLCFF